MWLKTDQKGRDKGRLTNERRLPQIASPPEHHLQELVVLIHHVVLFLQGDPGPVQTELLSLQLVPTWTKHSKNKTLIHIVTFGCVLANLSFNDQGLLQQFGIFLNLF